MRLEEDLKSIIALKTMEMRELEQKVRGEVELLWEKYRDGPGRREKSEEQEREASRSRSTSREPVQRHAFPPPQAVKPSAKPVKHPPLTVNPIRVEEATPTGISGSSLLSASLSDHPSPPRSPLAKSDAADDAITEISKTFNMRSDARAVAMSHVFSVLDNAMSSVTRKGGRERSTTLKTSGKDSWIDEERRLLATRALEDEEGKFDGRTPRSRARKELPPDEGKGTGRQTGTVAEIALHQESDEAEQREEKMVIARKVSDADREGQSFLLEMSKSFNRTSDYVFDFELDDPPSALSLDESTIPPPKPSPIVPNARNLVEANLTETFAADAPSHRSAWRRIEQDGMIYSSLRRGLATLDDEADENQPVISKLATSMPLDMSQPREQPMSPTEMERKTSLAERSDVLVPPLIAAMRERGVAQSSLGLDIATPPSPTPPRTSRGDTGFGERKGTKRYTADPGAVFETLADEAEDEEDD